MTEKPIVEQIAALQAASVTELVERYVEMFGKPPRSRHRTWLWRRIAWEVQARKYGGLSDVAKRRIDELVADLDIPLGRDADTVRGAVPRASNPGLPPIGSTITRVWRGRELRVTVMENGFAFENVVYRSLSAAANAITGSHVSGRAWFGLADRKAAK